MRKSLQEILRLVKTLWSQPIPCYFHTDHSVALIKQQFTPAARHCSSFENFLRHTVLNEDLWLVVGQQDRMINGEDIWNSPLLYDKLGVRYRLWRAALERGAEHLLSKTTSPWSACNAAAVQLL